MLILKDNIKNTLGKIYRDFRQTILKDLQRLKQSGLFISMKQNELVCLKVTGNAPNIEYYFWWRDYCFGLLIHDDALFHFMVSISDEYKYK